MSQTRIFALLGSCLLFAGLVTACAVPTAVPSGASEETPAPKPVVGTSISGESGPLTALTPAAGPSGQIAVPTEMFTHSGESLYVIDLDLNGRTVVLRPGQKIVLILDEAFKWDVDSADPAIISPVVTETIARQNQGIYEALSAGQTQLTANGEPLCRDQVPACMRPSIIFTLDIVVESN